MVIDKTITIDIAMNAGIALLGWCYIMLRAGMWLSLVFLKTWNKHRKQTQQQKAMNAFFEAFDTVFAMTQKARTAAPST
ncbi:DUF4752 family protein [Escherichia coli]|uniref:DUF4752 family protein n=1 Tax=Escherichia coli TaxID=562 RepID=UPI000B7E359A|nr:DUF4752 family protein [Escherichia coli]